MVIKRKKSYIKRDLLAEKKRLQTLLYYYAKDEEKDLIIKHQLARIESELRVLEES